MTSDLRERLLHSLDNHLVHESRAAAHAFLTQSTDAGRWRFVSRLVGNLPSGSLGLHPMRVALLASFSIEFLNDPLTALGLAEGLRIALYRSGFAQYHQELANRASGLYAFKPDVVILALEGQRVMQSVYDDFLSLQPADKTQLVARAMAQIEPLIVAFRRHSDALLLIHNFDPPRPLALGILDGLLDSGQTEVIQTMNIALSALARGHRGVFVVDYAGLVAQVGANNWYDLRMAYVAKAPIAQKEWPRLAREYIKFLRALSGQSRKCLVTDLDNTLWGGVVGEEGIGGIQLGVEYPGNAFVAFQKALGQLHARGVLLAIASKNNPADVEEVFLQHLGMVLRMDHFACREIHWQPKSQSLLAIAKRLNIGLEHMVFIDDSQVECEQIKSALPMVRVIQFPSRPCEAIQVLLHEGLFDTLNYSSEDKKRGQLYQQRAQAEELQAASSSLPQFYHSLAMQVSIEAVTKASLPRVAQLTQKTNQFNLTTFRYSEEEVARRMADPDWLIRTVRVVDCFGDNGIVGVMMAQVVGAEKILLVDTFLLSCRVIGRTIETAMLACLCVEARAWGLGVVRGRVIPSAKNAPARNLYQNHGFILQNASLVPDDLTHESLWELDLAQGDVVHPPWITLSGV